MSFTMQPVQRAEIKMSKERRAYLRANGMPEIDQLKKVSILRAGKDQGDFQTALEPIFAKIENKVPEVKGYIDYLRKNVANVLFDPQLQRDVKAEQEGFNAISSKEVDDWAKANPDLVAAEAAPSTGDEAPVETQF